MKHSLKTKIFKTLALLPDHVGYAAYHFLQNISGKLTLEDKIRSTNDSYQTILRILHANNVSIENAKIAELGSGWVPIFPYQLILEGKAKQVDTYDINEHYSVKEVEKLNKFYSSEYTVETQTKSKYPLLKTIFYFPKTDICNGDLKDIDLVLSRFVLEHVPPNEIIKMHKFFLSNLKSGSHILHLISPSDHRAYEDSSLSLQDFLKYSEEEWNQIQTKFDYHNRLRLPQYLALFKEEFEITFFEHNKLNTESESFKKFKKLKIHDDFKNFSDEELMAGNINILLKKK
ncbi:MAG: hypothetical protein ABI441_11655 [Flavobacterium sp.]